MLTLRIILANIKPYLGSGNTKLSPTYIGLGVYIVTKQLHYILSQPFVK